MAVIETALRVIIDVSLGVWLGAMAFFSFVAAPRVFAVLDQDAGDVVNDIFPRYYVIGTGLGVIAFVAGIGLGAVTEFDLVLGLLFLFVGLPVLLSAYARWVLIPRMDEATDAAFDRQHRRSVILNGVSMLSVLIALIVSHL